MDRRELATAITEMRESAGDYVLAYARFNARHVEQTDVTAIIAALGDISIDEAIAALDRLERERAS